MKISIVTVSLNSIETISRTVESVRDQSYSNIEHILVDGLSKDGTQDLIESLSDTANVSYKKIFERDKGIYDAMNKGVLVAEGDFVLILNSDDWLLAPDAIEHFVETAKNTEFDIFFTDVPVFDDAGCALRVFRSFRFAKNFPKLAMAIGVQLPHPGSLSRRDLYDTQLFDDDMKISADHKWTLGNIVRKNAKIFISARPVVGQLAGGASQRDLKAFLVGKQELLASYREVYVLPWAAVLVVLNLTFKAVSRLYSSREFKQ